MTPPPTGLPLTGERTLPGIWHETYWFQRHVAGYRWAAGVLPLPGAVVLEAGVGEGYGGQLLAESGAAAVLGLDLDAPSLRHVATTYPSIAPIRGNLVALPMRDEALDVVVSAQTVEHLWDQEGFVAECARVTRPGGWLVLTTPNRRTFPPGNVFHHRELDADDLTALVAPAFDVAELSGLHHGPRLTAQDRVLDGLVDAQLAAPPEQWPPALADAVRAVRAQDFTVGPADDCLDLLLLARRR